MTGSRWLPLLVLGVSPFVLAHDIITTKLTYTRDVQPILAHRCIQCHGAGSSIPLTSYDEVRPWAVDIKEQVLSRAMPPWGAVKGFRDLKPDQALTEDELTILAGWVVGGTPEGQPISGVAAAAAEPVRAEPAPALMADLPSKGTVVATRCQMDHPLAIAGIAPLVDGLVGSAKITAQLPNGGVEPLLWLSQFDGRSHRAFYFREPLELPAGTIVRSDVPLRFSLLR